MKKHTLRFPFILTSLVVGILSIVTINQLHANCVYAEALAVKELPVGNLLTWTTSREEDNELFLLQKSTDGETYKTISIVKGAGTSDKIKQYRYLDMTIGEQTAFYRLLDIDKWDQSTSSKVIRFQRSTINNLLITQLENNNDHQAFGFNLKSTTATVIELQLLNEMNEEQLMKRLPAIAGSNAVSIDATDFLPGTYRLVLQANGEREEAFFIKEITDDKSVPPVALYPERDKE